MSEAKQDVFFADGKKILDSLTLGIVVVDVKQNIVWFNKQFAQWSITDNPLGTQFYAALDYPNFIGPDYSPFHTNRNGRQTTYTSLSSRTTGQQFQMISVPIIERDGTVDYCLATVRDVSEQSEAGSTFDLLRDAGKELADLTEQDLHSLGPDERTDLLRAKIVKYAQEILHFDIIEIRLLSHDEPRLLKSLLAYGMTENARNRKLYAVQEGNGITGWVAYHGKPYLVEEASEDPFYIDGIVDARSSMTVPLKYHGRVIGTFNVESNQSKAFTENDMMFLQFYADYVTTAIHTLDLLSLEQRDAAFRSVSSIYTDVMQPLNDILVESARLFHLNRDKNLAFTEHLHRIQERTRTVREIIRQAGETIQPAPAEESDLDCRNFPMLRGKKILIISGDDSVVREINKMLFYYGCSVDSASDGGNAIKMLESTAYDIFISEIKLDDMSAFTCFERIREILATPYTPYIFLVNIGSYDGEHVMTKAAELGSTDRLGKPLNRKLLLRSLVSVLRKVQEQNCVPHKSPPHRGRADASSPSGCPGLTPFL